MKGKANDSEELTNYTWSIVIGFYNTVITIITIDVDDAPFPFCFFPSTKNMYHDSSCDFLYSTLQGFENGILSR
jgi:hypothetical protein